MAIRPRDYIKGAGQSYVPRGMQAHNREGAVLTTASLKVRISRFESVLISLLFQARHPPNPPATTTMVFDPHPPTLFINGVSSVIVVSFYVGNGLIPNQSPGGSDSCNVQIDGFRGADE